MAARWIAGGLAGVMVLIVGFFMLMALSPGAMRSAKEDGSPAANRAAVTSRIGALTVTVRATAQSGAVAVAVQVRDGAGRAADPAADPWAAASMAGMGEEIVPLRRLAGGEWAGQAALPMAGEWRLIVRLGEGALALPFTLPD